MFDARTAVAVLLGIGLVAAAGWGLYELSQEPSFEKSCDALGGTVLRKGDIGIGVGTGGNVIVTPITVQFCIVDGKIVR